MAISHVWKTRCKTKEIVQRLLMRVHAPLRRGGPGPVGIRPVQGRR
jgi:hypothetical protein